MYAMVLSARGAPLTLMERPDPIPGPGEVRVKVSACGVCRTDLHVVDGELPDIPIPSSRDTKSSAGSTRWEPASTTLKLGMRVGVPWLGFTCGECFYCRADKENLCDRPKFTGYTRDGGFASHLVADARYCFPLGEEGDDAALAPLLCAGLIGWRSLVMAGEGKALGIYGFGAAGHIVAQVARAQGRTIYAFTRRATPKRNSSRSRSARIGPAPRRTRRLPNSMPPSSTRRSDRWCRSRFAPCARAGAWSAPAFICRTFQPFPTASSGANGRSSPSPRRRRPWTPMRRCGRRTGGVVEAEQLASDAPERVAWVAVVLLGGQRQHAGRIAEDQHRRPAADDRRQARNLGVRAYPCLPKRVAYHPRPARRHRAGRRRAVRSVAPRHLTVPCRDPARAGHSSPRARQALPFPGNRRRRRGLSAGHGHLPAWVDRTGHPCRAVYVGPVIQEFDITAFDVEASGLLDGLEGRARTERAELIPWLLEQGVTVEQIQQSVQPMLLASRRLLGDDGTMVSAREISEANHIDLELLQRVQRASGLPRVEDPDVAVHLRADGEVAAYAQKFVDLGFSPDQIVLVVQVLSEGLARAADVMRYAALAAVSEPGATELDVAKRSESQMREVAPLLGPLITDMLRLQLLHVVETEAVNASERAEGIPLPGAREVTIAFADLVGFTRLGESFRRRIWRSSPTGSPTWPARSRCRRCATSRASATR